VNIDQEAANMLQYEQAYQAAAQVIATSQALFTSLLGAVQGG
jgi:flagellar hook-associated protein 1 FlgK